MFHHSKSKNINFAKIIKKAKSTYYEIPPIKERRKINFIILLLKSLSLAVIVLASVVFFWALINFASLKIIYEEATTGKENAEYAVRMAKDREFIKAFEFSKLAETNFSHARENLIGYQQNLIIKNSGFLTMQVNNFIYLLSAGEIVSQSIGEISQLGQDLGGFLGDDGMAFTKLNTEQKKILLGRLYEISPELNGIKSNLDLAEANLNNIKYNGLIRPFKNKIENFKNSLTLVDAYLDKVAPLVEFIPPLMGYPEKSAYLLLLQNSDELRPTGGFIGTYGLLEMTNGDVLRLDTHDIYHMDMPVKDKFGEKPPEPLKKYLGVNKLYMRDANWSPNWPTAASQLSWFYHEENKLLPPKNQINNFTGLFDGVIGITPKLVTDLLAVTGPIKIGADEYNQNNFIELLQYKVEKEYFQLGVPSWQRKEVIGDILKELKLRLLDLPAKDLLKVASIVNDNLYQKNILIYFYDKDLQDFVLEQGWGGELKNTGNDYVMVVDANMASLKTDAVINRLINYQAKQNNNGLISNLEINYSHSGSIDWKTTRYRSYTRIYVPLGCVLIKTEGFNGGQPATYNELGKTVFAGFLEVEPGSSKKLRINYKLPEELNKKAKNTGYQLYFQKQPGVMDTLLNVNLDFLNNIKSGNYLPLEFAPKRNSNSIRWESNLIVDREFSVDF